MKKKTAWLSALIVCAFLTAMLTRAEVQSRRGLARDDQLFQTIAALDAEVFAAYNACDLQEFGSFFPEELEFFHDNGGLTARSRSELVEALRKNICGKVRRELLAGTLEVYPMNGYGALQTGVHRFHHPGREEIDGVGEAKFIHLWQNQNGSWKITRIISYDHHPVGK